MSLSTPIEGEICIFQKNFLNVPPRKGVEFLDENPAQFVYYIQLIPFRKLQIYQLAQNLTQKAEKSPPPYGAVSILLFLV